MTAAPPGVRAFLARLAALPPETAIRSEDLDLPSGREQDTARKWCRRHGFAVYDRMAGGWAITPRGRAQLLTLQGGKACEQG
jgi:hypothetical protein